MAFDRVSHSPTYLVGLRGRNYTCVLFSGSTDGRQTDDVKTLTSWRHDMKNQLGIILGFADLLLQELESTNPHRADLGEIREAAARAMALISALKVDGE